MLEEGKEPLYRRWTPLLSKRLVFKRDFFGGSYFFLDSDADYKIRCFCEFVAGTLWMMTAFNVLHDGSHYGLSIRGDVNVWNSRTWCALGFWNFGISFYHQTFMDTILSLELNIEILIDSTFIRLPGRTNEIRRWLVFLDNFSRII